MSANNKKEILQLENTYANLPSAMFSFQEPVAVANPKLICYNNNLAKDLGLDFLTEEQLVDYFSGNNIPEDSKPLAQAYAGHQFGHFNMLGDGRSVLLGEHTDLKGDRFDIQLKGSGQTPYSRRGDGRATLYSMLREYLISEAMHHLGIPTTRSLSVVATGESVFREQKQEGGVLSRIASSHIRVGTFEFASYYGELEDLKTLTGYTIKRHYPEIQNTDNPALELLKVVTEKQIDLIVNWMRVGFIHGVMNTDNVSIAGETIDYGPCAFMNAYSLRTVFSSIDTHGRYAFGNQQYIGQWNLAKFASALLPLINEDEKKAVELAKPIIEDYQIQFNKKWYAMMFDKLGIKNPNKNDKDLVDSLLSLMETHKADYTQVFLALQEDKVLESELFKSDEFKAWLKQWKVKDISRELMSQHNPKVIPRNHWVENALEEAVSGDMSSFNDLLEVLSIPYGEHPDDLKFQAVPEDYDASYKTFCGT